MQTGREPDHGQVDETAKDVVAKLPGLCAVRAGVARDTGVASMMVMFPASAAPVIVRPISAVRQMVSATRLPVVGCTVGSWFGQMMVW